MNDTRTSQLGGPRIPGLDGIRGLAVLAVLVGHSGMWFGTQGILGVDVFFALSGYLICSLLCAELDEKGTVDLGGFWLRRAARLVPALAVVVAAIAVVEGLLHRWTDQDQLQGLAALSFTSNWTFAAHGVSYLDRYETPSPVLHTWSLGVEEQFYVVMPLLALSAWTLVARRFRPTLAALLCLIAGVSLVTAIQSTGSQTWAYYGTHTRAFELALGALAGLLAPPRRLARVSTGSRRLLAGAGLLALGLLVARLFLDPIPAATESAAPRLEVVALSILVVLAVVAIPTAWSGPLAHGPLLWLGIISYGVYLWHWPIYLWLTPDRTHLGGIALFLLRLGMICAVACASYLLLEKPLRTRLRSGRPLTGASALAASVAVVAAVAILSPETGHSPSGSYLFAAVGGAGSSTTEPVPPSEGKSSRGVPQPWGGPTTLPASPDTRVFIVGDSVGMNLRQLLTPQLSRGLVVDGSTWLGCSLVPGTLVAAGETRPPDPQCDAWARSWPRAARSFRPDIVLLMPGIGEQFDRQVGSRLLRGGSPEHLQYLTSQLTQLSSGLREQGLRVAMTTVPCHGAPDLGVSVDPAIINSQARMDEANRAIHSAAMASGAVVLDLATFLCPHGYDNVRDGVKLRVDGIHFTPAGAAIVWRWLNPALTLSAGAHVLPRAGAPGTRRSSGPAPLLPGSSGPSPVAPPPR